MGASIASVSPPLQRQLLCVARSISGFTSPSERASWKMSSPPILTARPRKMTQSSRPVAAEMTRVFDMVLFLLPRLEQAIVEAHITAEHSQSATQEERQDASNTYNAADQAQTHQPADQHNAV